MVIVRPNLETSSPIIKPFDQMSLDELYRERGEWDKIIENGWGDALGAAIGIRDQINALIAVRLSQVAEAA